VTAAFLAKESGKRPTKNPFPDIPKPNYKLNTSMTIAERILELKHSGQPFVIYLTDGRALRIPGGDYISLNPSGRGSNVTVYGGGQDEEHFIPIFAISRVCVEE
jgi:hypothetical protein